MASQSTPQPSVLAADLFSVNGLVAVITGGGSGAAPLTPSSLSPQLITPQASDA